MEIDATGRRHITEAERKRRKDLGLCFYCGQGHYAVDCGVMPKADREELRKRKAARIAAKATADSASAGKA